jgi:hypothetical protein
MISLPQTAVFTEVFVALSAGIHCFASVGGLRGFRVRRAADDAVADMLAPLTAISASNDYYQTFTVYLAVGDAVESIDGNAGAPSDAPASLAGVRLGDELFEE